ncbi:MAG TPA: GGDEF domain-containing protein, partial [Rhodospirillales bacterium]|nr:GGDEF domain-containing protein [Rhodospirillales bacterium]
MMADIDQIKLQKTFTHGDQAVLGEIAKILKPNAAEIINIFYSELLGHPDVELFLDSEIVAERLPKVVTEWLTGLFDPRTEEEIAAYVERQREIGRIHARLNIPMHLVVDGMRLVRREVNKRMISADIKRDILVQAIVLIDETLDHVMSLMNESYMNDLLQHERNLQSFKMQVPPLSLAMECERMRSFVYDWFNRTVLFFYENNAPSIGQWTTLERSEFGLWVIHKIPILVQEPKFETRLRHQVRSIDDAAAKTAAERAQGIGKQFTSNLHTLTDCVSEVAWALSSLIDETLKMESGRDTLTKLFNRRFLPTVIQHETELSTKHETPFGIIMFDIDHFKNVNDTHGHDAGDMVLRQFAEILAHNVRANDYVFRFGGEEFLVVLGDVVENAAFDIAEKARTTVADAAFKIGSGKNLNITTSVGIAIHDGHPDYNRTIKRADDALYSAKHGGRNRSVISPRSA